MADEGEKKIIVDEDWKSQVQAEKEQAAKAKEEGGPAESPDAEATSDERALPPASFATLLSMLATQAMVALGQIPDPVTGEASFDKELARYFIDTIGVIEEKTKGNLAPEEAGGIEDLLHQMRMAFVAMQQQPGA
jgi:hypothetical protein